MQGVSTRSVDNLVMAMGMTSISKSQVSRLLRGSGLYSAGWTPAAANRLARGSGTPWCLPRAMLDFKRNHNQFFVVAA